MKSLIFLEFRKTKGTFIIKLIPFILLAPIVLVLVTHFSDSQSTFINVVTKTSVFIQMISFSLIIILGCYAITREYKDNTMSYLCITLKSPSQVLISKYIMLFISILLTQIFIFGAMIILNNIIDGFSQEITMCLVKAGVLSSFTLSCITSIIVYIALLRRSFISSTMIFLFLFILTFPFSLINFTYALPHLLPLVLVSKLLGSSQYPDVNYFVSIFLLLMIFMVFYYLSIRKIAKR